VRGAKAGYLPRISAFGSLDYDYGPKFESGGGSYTAGGLLQWDIWDGNLTRAKAREARANLESAREEQRKVQLALGLEVEQARLELKAANERMTVTQQAVSQALESASLTQARFQQGAALSTQLMDAETALLSARVRRADAEADQRIALAALRKAVGLPQLESKPNAQK
jgi:outer membrane protein TolC